MALTSTLRERQAEQVRTAVLDGVIAELETRSVDDVSMAHVAAAAGVSLRTLYRYFPDRASLLEAAGRRVVESLSLPIDPGGPEGISASFLDAARRFSARPQLARALVQTSAGRTARSAARSERTGAVGAALASLTAGLDADTARRAEAVIAHLCSLTSWVSIAEESGLEDADAQQAVAWAIDVVVSALAAQPDDQRHPPSTTTVNKEEKQ